MTKTEQRAVARQARRWGHYRDGYRLWVNCPLCRARVEVDFSMHSYGGSVPRHLDAGMLDHLDGDCEPSS